MLPGNPDLEILQARVQELEETLGLTAPNIAVVFRLPASLAKLLGLLVSVPNVTPEMVEAKLGIVSDCKCAIHRLRRYLDMYCEQTGEQELQIRSRRTIGYWVDEPTKKRIRDLTQAPALAPALVAAE